MEGLCSRPQPTGTEVYDYGCVHGGSALRFIEHLGYETTSSMQSRCVDGHWLLLLGMTQSRTILPTIVSAC